MSCNITDSIVLFENQIQKFEADALFQKRDYTRAYTRIFSQAVQEIFDRISNEYCARLQGRAEDQPPHSLDGAAERLQSIAQTLLTSSGPEFQRREKTPEKETWANRQRNLVRMTRSLARQIESSRKRAESSIVKTLKQTMPERIKTAHRDSKALQAISLSIDPLDQTQRAAFEATIQEKEKWIRMVSLLKETEETEKDLQHYMRTADSFSARPDMRKGHLALEEATGELTRLRRERTGIAGILLGVYRQRGKRLEALEKKYRPEDLQALRQSGADLSGAEQDFRELAALVFYLKQMTEIPWENHPCSGVSEPFGKAYLTVEKILGRLSAPDGLISRLSFAMKGHLSFEERQMALNMLLNREDAVARKIPAWKAFLGARFQAPEESPKIQAAL